MILQNFSQNIRNIGLQGSTTNKSFLSLRQDPLHRLSLRRSKKQTKKSPKGIMHTTQKSSFWHADLLDWAEWLNRASYQNVTSSLLLHCSMEQAIKMSLPLCYFIAQSSSSRLDRAGFVLPHFTLPLLQTPWACELLAFSSMLVPWQKHITSILKYLQLIVTCSVKYHYQRQHSETDTWALRNSIPV